MKRMENQQTGQEWRYFNKVEKTRRIIAITLDMAEQCFAKRIAEERKAFIDEATRIATEIIERELKTSEGDTLTVVGDDNLVVEEKTIESEEIHSPPKKQKLELNEENIKILKQLKGIKETESKEKKEELEKKYKTKKKEEEDLERGKRIVEARLKQPPQEWTG